MCQCDQMYKYINLKKTVSYLYTVVFKDTIGELNRKIK